MSASMLRQMLEDAGALLKENKYQQALDSSRRVTQLDPNNFQAFMCVGLANFHLQKVRSACGCDCCCCSCESQVMNDLKCNFVVGRL